MDSIKNTLDDLTHHFNARMADFQKDLKSSCPKETTSNIEAQFNSFRSFVLSALESLQMQLKLLSKQCDEMEMRSRIKMLLVHGVHESQKEDTTASVTKLLADRLLIPDIKVSCFMRCHRLGHYSEGKTRAILVKFCDLETRDKVWFAKTKLKGSGITLSEFLTKGRHEAFLMARQRFGMSNCWTKNGAVVVLGSDGRRHSLSSVAELDTIPCAGTGSTSIPESTLPGASQSKVAYMSRSKRNTRK